VALNDLVLILYTVSFRVNSDFRFNSECETVDEIRNLNPLQEALILFVQENIPYQKCQLHEVLVDLVNFRFQFEPTLLQLQFE
jgi:hypothetical protein